MGGVGDGMGGREGGGWGGGGGTVPNLEQDHSCETGNKPLSLILHTKWYQHHIKFPHNREQL